MEYVSAILESDQGTLRKDFCLECWTLHQPAFQLENLKGVWKSRIPMKKDESAPSLNRSEKALELLRLAIKEEGENTASEAFILALYLARLKMLAFREEVLQKGEPFYVYEVTSTEEMFCIRKIDLSLLEVQVIQEQIAKKLKGFSLDQKI